MITTCDKCKEQFVIELKEEEVKDRISKVYFNCSHCNEEYISHYTSVLVKRKQHEIRNIQVKYEEVRGKDAKRAERLFKQFQKLKKEIGKEMDNLKKRIEG